MRGVVTLICRSGVAARTLKRECLSKLWKKTVVPERGIPVTNTGESPAWVREISSNESSFAEEAGTDKASLGRKRRLAGRSVVENHTASASATMGRWYHLRN